MKGESNKARMVNCPRCGRAAPWNEANPYRPFCSERCKLIDLGQWASEGYRIPQEDADIGKSGDEER
ncbi:MAG TPA: DNA gyrase inhibitor YacG [Burkholderiales bacterium]|nr:DNA gyrase inhibitor YacG [Burkholderiales bacterium]